MPSEKQPNKTCKPKSKRKELPKLNSEFDASVFKIVLQNGSKSFAWNHFGKLYNLEQKCYYDEGNVYCDICLLNLQERGESKELPSQSFEVKKYKSTTSTSCLLQHLNNEHDLREKPEQKASNKLEKYFGRSVYDSTKVKDKHYLLARRLVLLCARSLVSYAAVNGEGFYDFMKSYGIIVDFNIPDRTTLTRSALDDVYQEMIPTIKEIIQAADYSSLTFDLWTDNHRRRSFITFNYCCIDENFDLMNINLCTIIIRHRHTANEIGKQLQATIEKFGIKKGTFYVVTDRGSNIVKLIGDENMNNQFCLGHGLHNLIDKDGFGTVSEIDELLAKVFEVVRTLRYRSSELEEEVRVNL